MHSPLYLALIATLSGPAFAQQQAPAAAPQSIVVTGPRIHDYRDRLAACLARNCPVNEDVDATLALAEALFLNGDYRDARSAVRGSLGRNRDRASAFPEPVSDLYRTSTLLARNIGLDEEARRQSFGILNALQAGIPQEDHRHFTARFEIAEVQMMSGNFLGARRELRRLAEAARAAGREDVVTMAEVRELSYETIAFPAGGARLRLEQWSRLTAPADRLRATSARILLTRLYRSEGDTARADALFAEIGRSSPGGRRRLLHAPRYTLAQQEIRPLSNDERLDPTMLGSALNRMSDNMEDGWVDIGFWVTPEGRVSGVEILRHGAGTSWAEPLIEAIGGRLYSAGPEATFRMERYTYTSRYVQRTGTRLLQRSPAARVEYFDLSAGNAPPPPPARGDRRTPS